MDILTAERFDKVDEDIKQINIMVGLILEKIRPEVLEKEDKDGKGQKEQTTKTI